MNLRVRRFLSRDNKITVFSAARFDQNACEETIDGNDQGLGTWAFASAVDRLGPNAPIAAIFEAFNALLEEGGYPQRIVVNASKSVLDDLGATLLSSIS